MKLLPVLLLSALTAVAAVVVYDQIRGDEETPRPSPDAELRDAVESIEKRLNRFDEAVLRLSVPEADVVDDLLLARLERLERLLTKGIPDPAPLPSEAPAAREGEALAAPTPAGKPTPEDIESFRKLAAATRKQDLVNRNQRVVDATLKKLGLSLRDDQREQLVRAWGAFGPRRNEIWGEAKRRGAEQGEAVNWQRVIADTNNRVVREFAGTISGFINASDAEAISTSLNSRGK